MTKTIHETGEETAASESVAHLSEPDVGNFIHTLKESLTVSQTMCFVFYLQNCQLQQVPGTLVGIVKHVIYLYSLIF